MRTFGKGRFNKSVILTLCLFKFQNTYIVKKNCISERKEIQIFTIGDSDITDITDQ